VAALHVPTQEVPLHAWLLVQVEQVAPPVPHAALIVPAWHTLPWQQPLGQVAALQPETHCVPLQLWLELHNAHAPPPAPHAEVEVPGWQTFPWQQPLGQVAALQTKAHCPPTHESEPEQALQLLPPAPHAEVEVPAWHTLPAQQPEGQVAALQVDPPTQLPAVQLWLLEHTPQAEPPAPHAPRVLPGWHTLPAQHPSGHVVALHVDAPAQ
jgi:hypothetical protein